MSGSDDDQLCAAILGDRDALSFLLNKYSGGIREIVATEIDRKFQSIIDQDDVLQVTYIEAFLRICDLRTCDISSFIAWLRTIARNNLRDAIKGLTRAKRPDPRRRLYSTSDDESVNALFDLASSVQNTPSQAASAAERIRILNAALGQLPPDYGRVLKEYDLEYRPVEEIATGLGRSSGAVFMLRARALDRLRAILPSISAIYGSKQS